MNYAQLLDILQTVLVLITGGLALYFKHSEKAQKKANEVQSVISEIMANAILYIKEAEENYKDVSNAGGKKFEEVVDKLHDLVPDPLENIITREMIGNIVQRTFDEVERYVAMQLDEKLSK